jgi:putative ABC transport system ATP-binding protein
MIKLDAVSKVYRLGEVELHALHATSLGVERGEMVAIMGASGSGKSTLLNLIGTLDRPTEGSYWLDGELITDLDETELARLRNEKIGFVFQAFNLLPRETALENVELPMYYGGVPPRKRRARAMEMLDRVGLADWAGHLPTQLSGGQQQRVSLARALVNEPLMLLADEPTGALDSVATRSVMDLLTELHHQGITIGLVTHDAAVAAYAERRVIIEDGRVLHDTRASESHDRLG